MKKVIIFTMLSICFGYLIYGANADKRSEKTSPPVILGTPYRTLININNISMWLGNDGLSAHNPYTGDGGLTFPRQTTKAIYADGWIWGGYVNDGDSLQLRVGGQTYNIGTAGGRIISPGIAENPWADNVRIYRIRADYQTADLQLDAAEINQVSPDQVTQNMIDQVRNQYEQDWNEWPWQKGAPYYDNDSNGSYNPSVDEPGIADADQVVWFVANDLDENLTQGLYGSMPIGLEMQVTVWAYDREIPWSNVVFKRLRLIYKGISTTQQNDSISNMYIAQWSDPDIGDYKNDFAGCDSMLGLAYGYNGTATDNDYAAFDLIPPAMGYDLLQGPLVYTGNSADSAIFNLQKKSGMINLPMTSFVYFAAGGLYSDPPLGDYNGTIQWYQMLRGLPPLPQGPPDPASLIDPVSNKTTSFWLSGDPESTTGWVDGLLDAPSDRRLVMSSGPFTMAFGDTQEVVTAVIGAMGADYLNGVTLLKSYSPMVQEVYDGLFQSILSDLQITVYPINLEFDTVYVGYPDTKHITITNLGSKDTLNVTNITSTNPEFTPDTTVFALAAGASMPVKVIYNPLSEGYDTGILRIFNNDPDNPEIEVSMTGTGVIPPEISHTPDSVSKSLFTGAVATETFTINNTGASNLTWNIDIIPTADTLKKTYTLTAANSFYQSTVDDNTAITSDLSRIEPPVLQAELADLSDVNILFDRAHGQAGTIRWSVIISDLETRGATLTENNSEISSAVLNNIDILWIIEPDNFNYSEINVVQDWVLEGGAIILEGDDNSYSFNEILSGLNSGIEYADDHTPRKGVTTQIHDHETTAGVSSLYSVPDAYLSNIAYPARRIVDDLDDLYCLAAASKTGKGRIFAMADEFLSNNPVSKMTTDNRLFANQVFNWLVNAVDWITVEPDYGTLSAGSSTDLSLVFNAFGLGGGDYKAHLMIESNDPDEQMISVPIRLHVDGAPNIYADPDTIDFGQVFTGDTATVEIEIYNNGTLDLLISSAISQPAVYTNSPTLAGIDPGEFEIFTVTFMPQNIEDYAGTLTFTSNDPDQGTYVVDIEGQGVGPPVIAVSPDSLRADLFAGDSVDQKLTISNTGTSDLNYSISNINGSQNYALQFDGVNDYVLLPNQDRDNFTFEAWVKRDRLHGYQNDRLMISVNGGGWGIGFNSDNTIMLTKVGYGDVNSTGAISDTTEWHHVAVAYNGYEAIFYIDGNLDSNPSCSYTFNSSGGNYTIGSRGAWAEFFDGLIDEVRIWNIARSESEIKMSMNRELSGTETGLIGYWKFNEGSGNTVTDHSPNNNDGSLLGGVSWVSSDAPITSWLSVDPLSGAIPTGLSNVIIVSFNARTLISGDFYSDILINSNDPVTPLVTIPAHLHIVPAPEISLSDTVLDFGYAYIGYPKTDTLIVSNEGTKLLTVSDISSVNQDYISDTSHFNLLPDESYNLLVTFTPADLGPSPGFLTFSCDDRDEPNWSISLDGDVVIPPSVSVSHVSFSDSLETGETISEIITIKNSGGGPLYFNVTYNYNDYALQFDGVDDFISIPNSSVFLIGDGDMTLETWLYRASEGTFEGIMSHTNGEMMNGWWLAIQGNNELGFCMAGAWHGNQEVKILKNSWTHIAIIKTEFSVVKYYINGNYYIGEDIAMTIDNSDGNLNIGLVDSEDFTAIPQYFSGIIDEVRFWNIARSQSDIQNNMYQILTGTEPGLVGYWNFNEGSGNITNDQTTNENNGTLNGGVKWFASREQILITASPNSGEIPAGDSLDIEIICDASYLTEGEYEAEILISCNDPENQEIKIPVYMKVTPSGLESELITDIPKTYELQQNYPNPFNPVTHIRYGLPKISDVKIEVYNILGQKIEILLNKSMPAGYHEVEFDAQYLSSGVYLYRIEAGEFHDVKKMILLK